MIIWAVVFKHPSSGACMIHKAYTSEVLAIIESRELANYGGLEHVRVERVVVEDEPSESA